MFLLLPCATIKDKVTFPALGEAASIAADMTKARQTIREYSNVEHLLKRIQEGEVIMTKKIQFDKYLKAQVDLMRACVSNSYPCPFEYSSYMDSEKIVSTSGLTTKEQWAIQMVMSRYTINSIYHAAAYSSLEFIFTQTNNSYDKNYKNATKFITNLQITYKYFNEGFQPLKRLSEVYQTLEQLFSKNHKQQLDQIIEIRKEVFVSVNLLVACNLAYLKLEKYRLMSEYRSCKELAYSIHNIIKDTRTVLVKSGLINKVHSDMRIFMDIGELFYLAYSFYFLLEEHEDMKNKEEYGFIKKQFQQMIVQNCVICQQFAKIAQQVSKFPDKQSLDNVMFADSLIQTMLKDVQKKQYAYGINIHENKELQIPTVDQIIASRISQRNIWESISQF